MPKVKQSESIPKIGIVNTAYSNVDESMNATSRVNMDSVRLNVNIKTPIKKVNLLPKI